MPKKVPNLLADCWCHTCEVGFHHLGIARHRAAHRDRRENCDITFSTGERYKYNYGEKK